jgi:hypothetical protein
MAFLLLLLLLLCNFTVVAGVPGDPPRVEARRQGLHELLQPLLPNKG